MAIRSRLRGAGGWWLAAAAIAIAALCAWIIRPLDTGADLVTAAVVVVYPAGVVVFVSAVQLLVRARRRRRGRLVGYFTEGEAR